MKKKLLSLGLACCLFLLSGCGSVGSVMKNIKAGNADEANQLYLEKIAGNSEKEFDLEDALQTYIEGLYDDLNSGKVSVAEAQAFASTVYSMEMDSSSYTRKILSKLNDLILSKQAYEDAMDAVAGEDYLTAYMLLQNVIEEDSNYETASSKMTEIVNDGMRSLNQEIDDAVAAKEFQKAIDLVNEAISLWGNNEFLASMQDSIPTWWQESNIEEAEQLRQAGQYSEAKDKAIEYCLAFGLDEYPDAVSTELQLINAEWLNSVAQEAATAFGTGKDYQAAIRVLQASGLQGDDVDALIEQYQGYAPILLKTLTPTKSSKYMHVGSLYQSDHTDVNGNVYDAETVILPWSVAGSESDSYVIYYLYGEYCSFDATLFRTYTSLSVLDENWPQSTTVKLYGDGVLLYEGPQITRGTYEQYSIHADVTGVRELKIVLLGIGKVYETYWTDYEPLLGIANATIQK